MVGGGGGGGGRMAICESHLSETGSMPGQPSFLKGQPLVANCSHKHMGV